MQRPLQAMNGAADRLQPFLKCTATNFPLNFDSPGGRGHPVVLACAPRDLRRGTKLLAACGLLLRHHCLCSPIQTMMYEGKRQQPINQLGNDGGHSEMEPYWLMTDAVWWHNTITSVVQLSGQTWPGPCVLTDGQQGAPLMDAALRRWLWLKYAFR